MFAFRKASLLVAGAIVISVSPAFAQTVQHAWDGTETTQNFRFERNGSTSAWNAPKAYPGTYVPGEPTQYLITRFSFVNMFDSPMIFQVSNLRSVQDGVFATGGVHLLAYLGAYNPLDPSANYLGDSGFSCHGRGCGTDVDFSVLAEGNATIEVLALRVTGGSSPGSEFSFDAEFTDPSVVPEPSTYLLMAFGLAGVGFVSRRRTRHRVA